MRAALALALVAALTAACGDSGVVPDLDFGDVYTWKDGGPGDGGGPGLDGGGGPGLDGGGGPGLDGGGPGFDCGTTPWDSGNGSSDGGALPT